MQMKRGWRFWIFIFALAGTIGAGKQAATSKADIHAEILQVYNFQPHQLEKDQIQEKSVLLDRFWEKAKSQSLNYIPALRDELTDFSNPTFFLYDGSRLLLSLSKEPADRRVVLAAIARCDLRDLQLFDYFMLVHSLAAQGEDTSAAAFHILQEPKFQVFIPQHVLTLGQNYSLVYLLFPTDQNYWLRPAMERLRDEKDETAQQSLLLVLWYAQTPDSDKAIEGFSTDGSKPKASRAYAKDLASKKDLIDSGSSAAPGIASEESLRQARRERMKAVSDEALIDFDSYTLKIIAKRK